MIRKFILLAFLTAPLLHAAPEADPSVKLREQLKSTLLQLRKVQTDMANAQAAQASSEAKNKELEAQVAKLTKQNEESVKKGNAEKLKSDQDIAKLNERLADKDPNWPDAYMERATEYLRTTCQASWKGKSR